MASKESSQGADKKKALAESRSLVSLEEKREIFKTTESLYNFSTDEFNFSEKKSLSETGFARVYSMEYLRSKPRRTCAMKVVVNSDQDKEDVIRHSTFNNENIIHFYGCLLCTEFLGIIMEFAKHGSIYELLIERKATIPLSVGLKLKWIRDVVSGLIYLHDGHIPPIYHGDVKSKNILICAKPDGQTTAKLSGFRFTREVGNTASYPGRGSPLYMAPEVVAFKEKSFKSDVWSFGVTATEMFVERQPYKNLADAKVPLCDIVRRVHDGKTNALKALNEEEVKKLPREMALIIPLTQEHLPNRRCTMNDIANILSEEDEPSMVSACETVRSVCLSAPSEPY